VSIINANVEDLKVKEGKHVLYYISKGSDSKDSFVVVISEVYDVLNDYLIKRNYFKDSEPLFTSLSDRNANSRLSTQTTRIIVRNFFKKAYIVRKNIAPHSLRHTAVTMTILGGANIEQAREMAAHSSIETTASYFHDLKRLSDPAEEYIPKYLSVLS